MMRVTAVIVAMTAMASAGPRAPDGWAEDHEAASKVHKGELEVHVYSGPEGARYVVLSTENAGGSQREWAESTAKGLTKAGDRIVRDDIREVDGQLIADTIAQAANGERAHAKTVAAYEGEPRQLVVVVGSCWAVRADLLAHCEAVLPFVSLPVDARYAPHDYTRIYVLGGVVGGGLALAIVFAGVWTRVRRKKDLEKSSALVDGEEVTVSGKVRAVDKTLEAPLSGKKCVLFRTHARVYSRASVPRLISEPFELETVPFVIDTPRGVVRVDAPEVQIAVTPERAVGVAEERVMAFLERHRVQKREGVELDEMAVEPGQTVTVKGVLRACRDETSTAERGYRDELPTAYELVEGVTLLRVW
jgi:hypothetical protein